MQQHHMSTMMQQQQCRNTKAEDGGDTLTWVYAISMATAADQRPQTPATAHAATTAHAAPIAHAGVTVYAGDTEHAGGVAQHSTAQDSTARQGG